MNSKIAFAVVGFAAGFFVGYKLEPSIRPVENDPVDNRKKVRILSYHDEPVIVENGSAIVDFNPRDNSDMAAFMDDQGHNLVRAHSDPIKLVRLWIKRKNASMFEPQLCTDKDNNKVACTADKISARKVFLHMSTALAYIHWGTKEDSGVALFSAIQAFENHPLTGKKNPYRIKSLAAADGKEITLEAVKFIFGGKDQSFALKDGDKIKVQFCITPDEKYCTSYDPNNPQPPWPQP